jgi:hypothetical protein
MAKKLRKKELCLNCEIELDDHNYCPNCGQLNTDKKVSLKTLLQDFLGDYFTFDSKLIHSLEPLIKKPGQLTEEYNRGKRVRYILPLRLYIFFSILFFFVISIKSNFESSTVSNDNKISVTDTMAVALHHDIFETDSSVKESDYFTYRMNKSSNFTLIHDTISFLYGTDLYNRLEQNGKYYFAENHVDEFLSKFVENIPKAMFILLPLFALILKLIYIRSGIFYIEHLIFALHFHSNAFLYLILANLIDYSYFTGFISILVWFVLYFSLRRVYKQSKLKTFLKIILLQTFYFVCLLFTFIILLLYTLSG